MRNWILVLVLASIAAASADAQRRDTLARRDSIARADSLAREDSLRIVRELERIQGDSRRVRPSTMNPRTAPQPNNPTLLPNISAVGDLAGDLSPDGSTIEGGRRFDIREVEVAIQAAVDPYLRGDFIIGLHPGVVEIEEAYLTTLALPWGLEARAGKYHMPIGKQNTTHRAELHTIEYPWVIQRFLGAEGGKGTGLYLSKVLAPLGFYQELILTAVDQFPDEAHAHGEEEEAEEHEDAEAPNKKLSGLGFSARFRNYWDLSQATNIELSLSGATGRQAQALTCVIGGPTPIPDPTEEDCEQAGVPHSLNVRRSLVGADFTFRWRPLQQGLYRSFILQAEFMRQLNPALRLGGLAPGVIPVSEIPGDDLNGAYAMARYQLARRTFVAGRVDWLEQGEGGAYKAASGYLTFFPSEFSKLVAGFERTMPGRGQNGVNRVLLQATFAVGPHRPHPF